MLSLDYSIGMHLFLQKSGINYSVTGTAGAPPTLRDNPEKAGWLGCIYGSIHKSFSVLCMMLHYANASDMLEAQMQIYTQSGGDDEIELFYLSFPSKCTFKASL